jgi:hypothetical protein
MTIDSAYAISTSGILSSTVRYKNDSSYVRVRTTAPVNKINKLLYDLYLILEYKEDLVTIFVSEPGSEELIESDKTMRYHIRAPLLKNISYKENLHKALDKLLLYYH